MSHFYGTRSSNFSSFITFLLVLVSSCHGGKPVWEWESTGFHENFRSAKIGDKCFFPAWERHSRNILEKMLAYNEVKKDFREQYKKAHKEGTTQAENAFEFVKETAQKLHEARLSSSKKVYEQFITNSTNSYVDLTKTDVPILQALCEGGELLMCQQIGDTEEGTCRCLDLPNGGLLYNTTEEDGRCKGNLNSTCNPEDPVGGVVCKDKLTCFSFSVDQCHYMFGPNFHCEGYPEKSIGKQNLFCARHGTHPSSISIGSQTCMVIILLVSFAQLFVFVVI